MRKVIFRIWVSKKGYSDWMEGSFHQWGTTLEENTEGQAFVPATVAIVEAKDGVVYKVDPSEIQFTH